MIQFFFGIISDLFSYYLNVSLRWASCFISQPFFQEIYCSISRKIELNSTSEIELFAIAFENNLLTDRCFVSGIEIIFSCFVIFLSRVLLPTLNVDVNPKKPAKPADLKMSTGVILRSLEGAGRGALSFLSRRPQRDPSPEGAGRGAVNSSGSRYARNREAA